MVSTAGPGRTRTTAALAHSSRRWSERAADFRCRSSLVRRHESLSAGGRQTGLRSAKPDARGIAETQVSPGDYILSASRADLNTYFYGNLGDGIVQNIRIRPNQSNTITFPIFQPGGLSGTVRGELGELVSQVQVSLLQPRWQDGRAAMRLIQVATTDDRGQYRFAKITARAYAICVHPESIPARQVPLTGSHRVLATDIPPGEYLVVAWLTTSGNLNEVPYNTEQFQRDFASSLTRVTISEFDTQLTIDIPRLLPPKAVADSGPTPPVL